MDLDLEFIDESPVQVKCLNAPWFLEPCRTVQLFHVAPCRRASRFYRGSPYTPSGALAARDPRHLGAFGNPSLWNGRVELPFGTVPGAPCGSPFPGSVSE